VNESLRHHLNKHLDNIPDGATYGRTYGTFTSKVGSDGKFTGSTVLNKQASIASSGAVSVFSYTSTSTSITWTWTAFTVYFPDGSTIAVAASTVGTQVAFASLSASTTYHFGIYVDNAGTVHVVLSDLSGGIAKGSLGWQVQTINADGHAVIAVDTTAATPASGGGGGVPPGGSTCPADDEPIETQEFGFVPAVEVKAGMRVRGGDGGWKEVEDAYSVEGWLQHVWLDGDDVHHVDIGHRWLRSEGDFRADLDSERDWKLQRDLIPGDVVKGADEQLYPVMRISEPHRGSYRKIRVKPGENGDRSLRMGRAVTHNFITA